MLAKYFALCAVFATGILAHSTPADNTRNYDAARRAQEAAAAAAKKAAKGPTLNAGGHPTTGGLRPKKSKRSIDDIVRRAVDDVLFGDKVYARALYEEDDLYARDAELDFDDLYY